jgi:hypothetical protein
MELSTTEQMLIEQRVTDELGAHRSYIGRPGSGLAIFALIVLGVSPTVCHCFMDGTLDDRLLRSRE